MTKHYPLPPFKLEGNTATRAIVRDIATNTDGLYKVPLSICKIREGFQPRIKPEGMLEELWEQILHIPQLAEAIYLNGGPIDPVRGDIYKGDGNFYITEGERRIRALNYLVAQGKEFYPDGSGRVNEVKVILNPASTTDKERKRIAINSASKMEFTPMQRAKYYQKFVDEDNMTHTEVAEFLGTVSRQTVDNYVNCLSLPEATQDDIESGKISINDALKMYRESRKPKGNEALVDLESGEILTESQERRLAEEAKEKEKIRGDEDEFAQEDNSVDFPGSKGGPKEDRSSGEHVIGKDDIYMSGIKLAAWKQFVNRYEVLKEQILKAATLENGYLDKWEDELAERLKNEYNLTVK